MQVSPAPSAGTGVATATTIAYAASITPDVGTGGGRQIFKVGTLTGNITVNNPTGAPADGQICEYRFAQDGTGTRTLTLGNAFAWTDTIASTVFSTTASKKTALIFEWVAADSLWVVRGYSVR